MATLYGGTLANLLSGPAYWYYAPGTASRPTKIDDVIAMASPYTPKTNWLPGGGTSDASQYGRELEEQEYEIQQRTGAVATKIIGVSRTMTIPIAEITAEGMRIIEAAPAPTTIAQGAAASGTPAQTRLDFGSISTLPKYRVALIAERDKAFGGSAEGGARGPFAAILFFWASITADVSGMEIAAGNLVGRDLSFRAFPDPLVTDAEKAHGAYVEETGATVP